MIRVFYVNGCTNRKTEKATFANSLLALVFWKALDEWRKEDLVVEEDGRPVYEFRYIGLDDMSMLAFVHPLTHRISDEERERWIKQGYEFDSARKDK